MSEKQTLSLFMYLLDLIMVVCVLSALCPKIFTIIASTIVLIIILIFIGFIIHPIITLIENSIINSSKNYLHHKELDFKTSIDDIKITEQQALSILIELNDVLIPNYLENKHLYDTLNHLNPISNQDKQIKQNKISQIETNINDLKQQILFKTDQIKDIINHK